MVYPNGAACLKNGNKSDLLRPSINWLNQHLLTYRISLLLSGILFAATEQKISFFRLSFWISHLEKLDDLLLRFLPNVRRYVFRRRDAFFLSSRCPGLSCRCDHTSWFPRLESKRTGDSPNAKWRFGWMGKSARYLKTLHFLILSMNFSLLFCFFLSNRRRALNV